MNFKIKNTKLVFSILLILLFILVVLVYNFVIYDMITKDKFANQVTKIAEENQNTVFKVHKIMMYSGASAVDVTDTQALENIDICQFTDIGIFIDNTSSIYDVTDRNTVKKLYIDNIKISTKNPNVGKQYINYKNPLNFGKYKKLNELNGDKIDFNIINTNSQNENQDYSSPTFYTDCSNPITLEYMNTDIVKNHAVSQESRTVSFNGKILQEANVKLEDISYTLSFNINIINNLNQKFVCNLKLDINLNDNNGGIYKGYLYNSYTVSGKDYNFFEMVNE